MTTDLSKNREVVLTEGSLFEAIRASISIPLVITPLLKNDTLFVDGGVLNPVPVNRVFRQEDDILIAVNVNAQIPDQTKTVYNSEWRYFEKLTSGKLKRFQKKLSRLVTLNRKDSVGYFNLNPFKSFTGERALWRKDILPLVDKMKKSRFGVETLINLYTNQKVKLLNM